MTRPERAKKRRFYHTPASLQFFFAYINYFCILVYGSAYAPGKEKAGVMQTQAQV